jgi:hypothetical protein
MNGLPVYDEDKGTNMRGVVYRVDVELALIALQITIDAYHCWIEMCPGI